MPLSFRPFLASALLAAASLPALADASPHFPLTSTKVELPTSDRVFPIGPGVETVTANCLTCHSAGMILNQPALKRAAWEGEVRKMIGVYKAPVAEADVAAIIDYLAKTKGAD